MSILLIYEILVRDFFVQLLFYLVTYRPVVVCAFHLFQTPSNGGEVVIIMLNSVLQMGSNQ
jgi:hypothetical protein